MANRFIEGFDYLASADLIKRWTDIGNGATTVSAGTGRNGTSSMHMTDWNRTVAKTFDAQATWIVGFAIKVAAFPVSARAMVTLIDGVTTHCDIRLNPTGVITVTRNGTLLATGTTVLTAGIFNYIEFKCTISDTVGVVEVQVNGASESLTFVTGTSSTQDTRNGGNASANIVQFGAASGLAATIDWDGIYINDGSGGVDDNFWGDVRVIAITVDGAGNSAQFTPSTGSNWQNVDDSTPDGDSTYNESSTVNHIDSMTTTALGVTGTVKGVELMVYARKTDAGSGSLAPLWRISGTDYPGTGVALSTDYIYIAQRYRVSPATSSAWTTSEIDGAEIGYKRTA